MNPSGENINEQYIKTISALHSTYSPMTRHIISNLKEFYLDIKNAEVMFGLDDAAYRVGSVLEFIYNDIKYDSTLKAQQIFNFSIACNITYMSTVLALQLPDLFVPYYFLYNFNILEKICNEFDIDIPPIPAKKDYEDRFYYYGELCLSFIEFREKHNMTPYEFMAFLYDYAPKAVGGIDSYIVKDLPEPKSAYFIGGSSDDAFLTDDENAIACWQCNPDTQAGDMIVMYLRTPISAVDSIWRSVSIGFNDPFFYYYRCTYIGKPKSVKRFTQKQMKKDKFFKDLPIVRKNMQGINGVELLPSQYNHLIDITKSDTTKLEFTIIDNDYDFTREKDVENKLIIPLISKLGFNETEYAPQMHIAVGNHNTMLIPDFVLLPNDRIGCESAFAIIEAKLTIPDSKALNKVKNQARSYARQVLAEYSVIADKNKVYLYSKTDDFEKEIFIATWEELNDADYFKKLRDIIGEK